MSLDQQIEDLLAQAPGFWHLDACGVTRSERQIPALLHGVDQPPAGERLQLVLIGGLSGKQEDADAALAALHSYRIAPGLSGRYALSAAPCANPDGLALGAAPENGAGGNPGALGTTCTRDASTRPRPTRAERTCWDGTITARARGKV